MSPRAIAERVWRAGVAAVDSRRLVADAVRGLAGEIAAKERLLVLGAGKAGAGMAAGVLDAVADSRVAPAKAGPSSSPAFRRGSARVDGVLSVPADCVRDLPPVRLLAGRPAGVNEPRPEGVAATREILSLARAADADTFALVLISGGGSALLVAPAAGVTLEAKQAVTRLMASRGAPIGDLNAVRSRLSDVKAGGLARALTNAGSVHALVISDVIGDPLPVIASGPCVAAADPPDAAAVLAKYEPDESEWPAGVADALRRTPPPPPRAVPHSLVGTNATAVDAAAAEARSLGFAVEVLGSGRAGTVEEAAAFWAESIRRAEATDKPLVLIDGGEPTVSLPPNPGRGGRNQQLALDVLRRLRGDERGWAFLSGGTDGEDGPTDAAGGGVGPFAGGPEIEPHLERFDAYPWLEAAGCLLKTGPTHTNVMDLRVGVVAAQR